jgi:hypothetical protein
LSTGKDTDSKSNASVTDGKKAASVADSTDTSFIVKPEVVATEGVKIKKTDGKTAATDGEKEASVTDGKTFVKPDVVVVKPHVEATPSGPVVNKLNTNGEEHDHQWETYSVPLKMFGHSQESIDQMRFTFDGAWNFLAANAYLNDRKNLLLQASLTYGGDELPVPPVQQTPVPSSVTSPTAVSHAEPTPVKHAPTPSSVTEPAAGGNEEVPRLRNAAAPSSVTTPTAAGNAKVLSVQPTPTQSSGPTPPNAPSKNGGPALTIAGGKKTKKGKKGKQPESTGSVSPFKQQPESALNPGLDVSL